jgi:hypothetical protein
MQKPDKLTCIHLNSRPLKTHPKQTKTTQTKELESKKPLSLGILNNIGTPLYNR